MIATETFIHEDADGEHYIVAGVTHLSDSHPWLRDPAVAAKFAPLGSRAAKDALRAQRPRSFALPAGTRVLAPASEREIVLTEKAREQIRRLIDETDDGRETGGGLFGYVEDRAIVVVEADGPGLFDDRGPTYLAVDSDRLRVLEEDARRRIGARLVGGWHTHVQGGYEPSRGDRNAWATRRNQFGLGGYVGVIATPAAGAPEHGWRWERGVILTGWLSTFGSTRSVELLEHEGQTPPWRLP